MPHFNLPELLIVLVIVVILFGAGRVSKLGGELGTAIREFRKGLTGDEPEKAKTDETPKPSEPETK
jgi:sec-independent protein translocase protein TatA